MARTGTKKASNANAIDNKENVNLTPPLSVTGLLKIIEFWLGSS